MRSLGIISGLFLQKDFTYIKKRTKCKQATFIQIFLYVQKALKRKQATFTHKYIKSKQTN